jgi:CBS domain-containing protein
MNLDGSIEPIIAKKGGQVFSISSEQFIFDALTLMAEKRIGALVVRDGDKLSGIFSERDYARRVVLAGRSSREMKVKEIMTIDVVTVTKESTVSECMQHMTNRRCRHLPVMDGDKVVAVVSLGDLVGWIMSTQDKAIHELEDYIGGEYPG